jgi:hypothetical protein
MVRIIEDLACDWRRLNERVERLSDEIEAIARQDAGCERLMSVPGIGPTHPRQDIQAWQSLSAGSVRAGGLGRADQAEDLGAPRAQALDRGGQEAAPSQRAGDSTCQQTRGGCAAGPNALRGSGPKQSRARSALTQTGSPDPQNDRICIMSSCPRQ